MGKFLARLGFVALTFTLGVTYGIVAHAQMVPDAPAPRAIECSAAFELMSRAAPRWSSEPAVREARAAWAGHVNVVSRQAGVDARTQVNQEMSRIAEATVSNPQILSALAMQCIADAPTR